MLPRLIGSLAVLAFLATASPAAAQVAVPLPRPRTPPVTKPGSSGNAGADAVLKAAKRAPTVRFFRLARPDCSPVSETAVLAVGRFERRPDGDPFGPIEARAVYSDGRTRAIGARITAGTETAIDFEITDGSLSVSGDMPVAYAALMRLASSSHTPNARVNIRWRFVPDVTFTGSAGDLRLTRIDDRRVRVRLPELRFSQVSGPVVVRMFRSGQSAVAQATRRERVGYTPEGGFASREVDDAIFPVPASWGGSDPATWSGSVEVVASGPATACTSARQPSDSARIAFTGRTTSSSTTLAGRWYRIFCTCNNEYQIVDAELRACNGGGVGQGLRCGQLAGAADFGYPGPWRCELARLADDADRSACDPSAWNWSLVTSRIRR